MKLDKTMAHVNFFMRAFTIFLVLVIISGMSSAATKVLFYETGKTSSAYRIDTDYSKFKEALKDKGYSVSKIELDLSRSALESRDPDVLVIVDLKGSLSADEMAAIFEFVMQKGKSLFICGGTSSANQLTIPFGMTIDTGMLEDESSPIYESSSGKYISDKSKFVVSRFNRQNQDIRTVLQGVNSLAFFGGYGISVSGSAEGVAFGDYDTYSPKSLIFTKGTQPPVAAEAMVGNGLVFLLSDADMLANPNLDTSKYNYDNLKFGTNIIDWLASSKYRPLRDTSIDNLTMAIAQLHIQVEELNNTINNQNEQIKKLNAQIASLTSDKEKLALRVIELESQTDPIMHIKYDTWVIIGIIFAIFFVGIVMATRTRKSKPKENDEIAGFGYELEGEESFEGAEAEFLSDEEIRKQIGAPSERS
ncbi:MAG TPA: hypothetical protein EYP86_03075 [Candidatus Altiarchaeales archaeon]|nr:hypothetical protein [Candidatus Altiarchaeales archaeon]